jgi:DNA-binding MarR family transcriptional regulator
MALFRRVGGAGVLIEENGEMPESNKSPSSEPSTDDQAKGDVLKSLGTQFNDPCLKSSTRVLIIFSLALNGKLGFGDLLTLTGTGKGSLSNHLEKLEASGYVKIKNMMTFSGSRTVVEVTQKGLESYDSLLSALKKLGK